MNSKPSNDDFGILTKTWEGDFVKAAALAVSLRHTNPGVELAVVSSPQVLNKLRGLFDVYIEEEPNLRGFEHKLHLDRYTPFDKTLFLDADILVFRQVSEFVRRCEGMPLTSRGEWTSSGTSAFGLDRQLVLKQFDRKRFASIGGAGHYYFEAGRSEEVFALARDIGGRYGEIAAGAGFADEDILGIAMSILELPPVENRGFMGRVRHAKPRTVKISADPLSCEYVPLGESSLLRPIALHFAVKECPFRYHRLIDDLLGDDRQGLGPAWIRRALPEWWSNDVRSRLRKMANRIRG